MPSAFYGTRSAYYLYFVPELLIAARAMKQALEVIKPALVATGAKPVGRVAIGTVKGDLHDIGKNLVAAMLEGGGFEIIDLGVDVTPDKFVGAVKDKSANLIALSALLTTTMPSMKTTIEQLEEAGRSRQREGDHRRRAGDPEVRRRNRRRRLQRQRQRRGHPRPPADRHEVEARSQKLEARRTTTTTRVRTHPSSSVVRQSSFAFPAMNALLQSPARQQRPC